AGYTRAGPSTCSQLPAPPPPLPSSPTRRSSDLVEHRQQVLLEGLAAANAHVLFVDRRQQRHLFADAHDHPRAGERLVEPLSYLRSEEHTSEPQSRENLVCRLLLAKRRTAARSRA